MVTNQDLADASIALSHVLTKRKVKFGLFGEYAVTLLGGQRSCTKLDCRIATTKDTLLQILDGKRGFRAGKPLCRPGGSGAAGFLWNSKKDKSRKSTVWVLFRCDDCPDVRNDMVGVCFNEVAVAGRYEGKGKTWVLDSFTVFCSKLLAAAVRDSFTDTVDIRCLVQHHGETIKARAYGLDLRIVGLIIQRHQLLEATFVHLGIDVAKAKQLVKKQVLAAAEDVGLKKMESENNGGAERNFWKRISSEH